MVDPSRIPENATYIQSLKEWSLRTWNPYDFDWNFPSKPLNGFLLFQAVVGVILNGMILTAAYRCRHKVLTNASSRLSVNLCMGYLVYGSCVTVMRIVLAAELAWPELLCYFSMCTNVWALATGCFTITNAAIERYASIVLQKSLTKRQANLMSLVAQILAFGFVCIHAVGQHPVISNSGVYCYPASMGLFLGTIDNVLLSMQSVSIAIVYALVVRTLRKASRKINKTSTNKSVESLPTMVASGSKPSALSPAASVPAAEPKSLAVTDRAETPQALNGSSLMIADPRASAQALNSSQSAIGETSSSGAAQRKQQRKQKDAARSRNAEIERRIAIRGIWSLIASLFTSVPTIAFVGLMLSTGNRNSAAFDAYYMVSKLITEIADPVILLTMDIRFRSAVIETFFWWLPQKASGFPYAPLNAYLLIQAIAGVTLNSMILFAAIRCRQKVLTNASSLLSLNLCAGHLLYGACIIAIRISLVIDYSWPEPLCYFNQAVTVYFVGTTCFTILNVALERVMSIIRLKSLTMKQTAILCIIAQGLSLAFMLLHSLGHRPVIGVSGILCYPAAMGEALGAVDIVILALQTILIPIVYYAIVKTLRKASKKLDSSGASQSNNPSSVTGSMTKSASVSVTPEPKSLSVAGRTDTQTSGLARASSALADVPSSSALVLAQSPSPRKPRGTQSMSRSRNAAMERKIVLRGIFSLIASLFTTMPTMMFVGLLVSSGKRTSGAFDAYYMISKLITEIADPVILLTMDPRFRNAMSK
ncbi:hypothetical protein H9P43_003931 [Blastocladiella emersonii ATCC 22665]|nr:hypothetical protein H9P43_003931 [Blastocladiella emersonii ATCC 22665]